MEDKVYELLNKMYSEMHEGFKKIGTSIDIAEEKIDKMDEEVSNLDKDFVDLKKGNKEIIAMLLDLDSNDANRHRELSGKIGELRKNLNNRDNNNL